MARTPKQRKASADNLKKARAAKARGAVPVNPKPTKEAVKRRHTPTQAKILRETGLHSMAEVTRQADTRSKLAAIQMHSKTLAKQVKSGDTAGAAKTRKMLRSIGTVKVR